MCGFSTGQPRIHQGNQIHGSGCPAFEIGKTWIFFGFEYCIRVGLHFETDAVILSSLLSVLILRNIK